MSEVANNDTESSEKPVQENEKPKFPPFPDPTDNDFEEDIPEEERTYYKDKFKDLHAITKFKLHCTACDRHLGCSARNESRMRSHPMLRTLVCHTCHTFYNSGEFEKGDDGSELYCRWCGQGGQVYCCSDCPHVFCAKCVRRNLGNPKIKEIEELDDWKCFKCNNKCLWDLRAVCWAVLRYCDLKNKITYVTQDPALKEIYQTDCSQDLSECCKNKAAKRREKQESKKKESDSGKKTAALISKIPPTIQVKKFASIVNEDSIKIEKKAQKRPASPKNKPIIIKNSISLASKPNQQYHVNHLSISPMQKKVRMSSPLINPIRFSNDRKTPQTYSGYPRIRPKPPVTPMSMMFNGLNNASAFTNDNINLSLESLTQGLDMSVAVAAMSTSAINTVDDDVVCTPDIPLEPLCEVMEDNGDDDVQCMTPGPVAAPKPPPPAAPRPLPDITPENIVQMTDNDVTVNMHTGGLKFRVDPQTLSSNKMYRLPDGRIFAINPNPNMPGGYSATIVAVTENMSGKLASNPKGTTYAAKLSAVSNRNVTPPPLKPIVRGQNNRSNKRSTPKSRKKNKATDNSNRTCDLNIPVEWYRYNLVDAVDALEYSLSRLHQLKKDATTMHLRTRSVNEMRYLHRSLERTLTTSTTRFKEIRDNLNKEFQLYLDRKTNGDNSDDDDDDVEILPEDDDDPIFIDENSLESTANETNDIDLTAIGSSDHNDSSEKSIEKNDNDKSEIDAIVVDNETASKDNETNGSEDAAESNGDKSHNHESEMESENIQNDSINHKEVQDNKQNEESREKSVKTDKEDVDEDMQDDKDNIEEEKEDTEQQATKESETSSKDTINGSLEKSNDVNETEKNDKIDEDKILNENSNPVDNDKKSQDTDMSEEMIEDLLKDDNGGESSQNIHCSDISDEIQNPLVSDDKD